MPRTTDSDLNKAAEQNIVFRQNVDCPECDTLCADVEFPTDAKDEDGLADLSPGDLHAEVTCPNGHHFTAEYDGWMSYGEA